MGKEINVEERLLGMMAVEKRMLSEKQLIEVLNTKEFFEPDKSLEQIFLDKEYLTRHQIERLRQSLQDSLDVPEEENAAVAKRFGDLALEQHMIDNDSLASVLSEQDVYHQRGLRVQIGQLFCKRGLLTIAQVKRILESQLKKALYCKNCKVTTVIHDYNPSRIYQCEQCRWDLIEAQVKDASKPVKPPVKDEDIEDQYDSDDVDEDDHDEDVGNLDILEL